MDNVIVYRGVYRALFFNPSRAGEFLVQPAMNLTDCVYLFNMHMHLSRYEPNVFAGIAMHVWELPPDGAGADAAL